MTKRQFICFALMMDVCASLLTVAQDKNPLQAVTAWGRWLFTYDAACWVATDSVMATHPDSSTLGVYVAIQVGDQWVVAFGRVDSTRFQMSHEVIVDSTNRVAASASHSPDHDAPDVLLRAARAFQTGVAAFGRPSRPYNPMVLPQSNGTWSVYLVPAETSSDSVYIGGDVRYTVSSDGLSIIDTTELHSSLLVAAKPPANMQQAAMVRSSGLLPMPCETDVFYVLRQHPRVVHYIAAGERAYVVDVDGEIRLVAPNLSR
jgi:hypothetical protein